MIYHILQDFSRLEKAELTKVLIEPILKIASFPTRSRVDMDERAEFIFLVWVHLQQQINEATTNGLKLQLIAQRQAVGGMLKEMGYDIKVAAPEIPQREIEVTFNLVESGENQTIASEKLIVQISEEQLRKVEQSASSEKRNEAPKRELLTPEESAKLFKEIMGDDTIS